jgi:hypothetical protein
MRSPSRSILRALALLFVCAVATAASGPVRQFDCGAERAVVPSQVEGRLLILPGVGNTRFHLAGFVAAAKAQLPLRRRGQDVGRAVHDDPQSARA